MAVNFKNAAAGNAAAIEEIYSSCAGRFEALARLLCANKAMASKAASSVWENLMKDVKSGRIASLDALTGEGVDMVTAACRDLVARADRRAFSPGTAKETEETAELPSKLYPGDPEKGLASLSKALQALTPIQRFVTVLTASGVPLSKTASVVNQSEGMVRGILAQSLPLLEKSLTSLSQKNYSIDIPKPDQLPELLEKGLAAAKPSAETDKAAGVILRSFEVKQPAWKKYALACCAVVLCLCGVIAGVRASQTKKAEENAAAEGQALASSEIYANIDVRDYGTIRVKLEPSAAPITVENFVKLAKSGFYDGLTFHRIMEGFMIQGGDPDGNGSGGSGENIKGEFSANGVENSLSHTRGAISMARNSFDMDSASSQFFIVHEDSTFLDGDYACFGYVTDGMEVVDAIAEDAQPIDNNGTIPADQQPVITSITIEEN